MPFFKSSPSCLLTFLLLLPALAFLGFSWWKKDNCLQDSCATSSSFFSLRDSTPVFENEPSQTKEDFVIENNSHSENESENNESLFPDENVPEENTYEENDDSSEKNDSLEKDETIEASENSSLEDKTSSEGDSLPFLLEIDAIISGSNQGNDDLDFDFKSSPAQEKYLPDPFIPLSPSSISYLIYHHPLNLTISNDTLFSLGSAPNFTRDTGIHLITTFFHGAYHSRRFHEIVATLVSNLENPYISNVHILYEGIDPRLFIPHIIQRKIIQAGIQDKIVLTKVKKQPTYKEMFDYVNTNLDRGSIAIVSNADIYFDASLKCIYFLESKKKINAHTSGRPMFALSRRHSVECMTADYRSFLDLCDIYIQSHDSFIFAPPVPKAILDKTGHTQNQGYGAENIVIYEFKRQHFQVSNPCFPIHGFHLHCSNERNYPAKVITKKRLATSIPTDPECLSENLALY